MARKSKFKLLPIYLTIGIAVLLATIGLVIYGISNSWNVAEFFTSNTMIAVYCIIGLWLAFGVGLLLDWFYKKIKM